TQEPIQMLTDAALRLIRPRVAPVRVYTRETDMPLAHKTLWGILAIVHNCSNSDNSAIFISMNMNAHGKDADDFWYWKKIYDPADDRFVWKEKGDTGTYTHPGHGFRRAIGRKGKTRRLRGRVSLRSGNAFQAGGEYNIFSGDIAAEDTPR